MPFPKPSLRSEAATRGHDGLTGIRPWRNLAKFSIPVAITKQAFRAALDAVRRAAGGRDTSATARWWEASQEHGIRPDISCRLCMSHAGFCRQFRQDSPGQRLQVTEYDPPRLSYHFPRSQIPAEERVSEIRGGELAWVVTTESLNQLITMLLIISVL